MGEQAFAPLVPQEQAPSAMLESTLAQGRPLAPLPAPTGPAQPAQKEPGTFWPTAIAVIAAAEGNFGPLTQIMEQKRKTKLFAQVPGIMTEVSRLTNTGKIDEANEYLQKQSALLGSRAPEIKEHFAPHLARIAKWQEGMTQKKQFVNMERKLQKVLPDYSPTRKAMVDALADVETPMTYEQFQKAMADVDPKIFLSEGREIRSLPIGGTETKALPNVAQKGDITTEAYTRIGAKFPNLTPDVITDVLNAGSPEEKAHMNTLVSTAKQETLSFEYGKATMPEPAIRDAMRENGVSTYELAHGTYSGEQVKQGIAQNFQREIMHAQAPYKAQLLENPFFTSGGRVMAISQTEGPTYGKILKNVNWRDAEAAGGAAIWPTDHVIANVIPLQTAQQNFQDLMPLIHYTTEEGAIARIGEGVAQYINNRVPGGLTPDMSKRQVAAALVKGIVEQLANAGQVKREDMKQIHETLGGAFSTKANADAGIEAFSVFIKNKLDPYVKQQQGIPKASIPAATLSKGTQTTLPGNALNLPIKPPSEAVVPPPEGTPAPPATTSTTKTGVVIDWSKAK